MWGMDGASYRRRMSNSAKYLSRSTLGNGVVGGRRRRPWLFVSAAAAVLGCGAVVGSASADPWWQGAPAGGSVHASAAAPATDPIVVPPDQQDRRRAVQAQPVALTTLRVTSVARAQRQTKTGFISQEDVLRSGVKIGTDVVSCTFARVDRCRVVLALAGGTIAATFSAGASGGPLEIVGGTGAYSHATGHGSYQNLDRTGHRTAVTFHLG